MNQLRRLFLCAALLSVPALCMGNDDVSLVTLEDGSTIGVSKSGHVLWQRRGPSGGAEPRSSSPVRQAVSPASAESPAWDPLTMLAPAQSQNVRGPVFDSLGNAWVVINNGVSLIAVQSNESTGTWKEPHVIGPALPTKIYTVGVTVDQAVGFYVTYSTGSDSSYPLLWTKYTPNRGWQAPAVIYTSPSSFFETFPMIDSKGRLVIVFNANGVSSIASSPDQTTWGRVQYLTPLGENPRGGSVVVPTAASNKSGTRLVLVYLKTIVGAGMHYTFFDSSSGRWGPVSSIPGSEKATAAFYGAESLFPVAVDEAGNVTLATALQDKYSRDPSYTVAGYRYEGGQWSIENLTPYAGALPIIDNFSSIALRSDGSVLIATPLSDGASGANTTVFRYTPGPGWSTEIAAHSEASTVSRCAISWFQSTGASLAYSDLAIPDIPLQAATYINGTWTSGPPVPSYLYVLAPRMGTALTGEALLVAPSAATVAPGTFVTWLR